MAASLIGDQAEYENWTITTALFYGCGVVTNWHSKACAERVYRTSEKIFF